MVVDLGLVALTIGGLLHLARRVIYLPKFTPPATHDDAWASVALAYSGPVDGLLPIGVVRVQNPAAAAVIVSVSVSEDRAVFRRRSPLLGAGPPLSVRVLRVGRRLRAPKESILGAVSGGATGLWELPLGEAGSWPVVRVRVDQTASLQAFHLETGPRQHRTRWPAGYLGHRIKAAKRRPLGELAASPALMSPGECF